MIPLLTTQLILREILPGLESENAKTQTAMVSYAFLVAGFIVNGLTFLETLVVFPLIHITFFYF